MQTPRHVASNENYLSFSGYTRELKSWKTLLQLAEQVLIVFGHDPHRVILNNAGKFQKNLLYRNAIKKDFDLTDPDVDFHFFQTVSRWRDTLSIFNIRGSFSFSKVYREETKTQYIGIDARITELNQDLEFVIQSLAKLVALEFQDCAAFVSLFSEMNSCFDYQAANESGPFSGYGQNTPLFEEFDWYKRLRDPIELMVVHGRFRNVYRWNLLNTKQYEWLNRAVRESGKPLIGTLEQVSDRHHLWTVPEEDRPEAFERLKKVRGTHYRFFHSSTGIM